MAKKLSKRYELSTELNSHTFIVTSYKSESTYSRYMVDTLKHTCTCPYAAKTSKKNCNTTCNHLKYVLNTTRNY